MKNALLIGGALYLGIGAYFALKLYNNRRNALPPLPPLKHSYPMLIFLWPVAWAQDIDQ